MSGKQIIAITQELADEEIFLHQIKNLANSGINALILRRRDLSEEAYFTLAKEVINICERYGCRCILHYFYEVALRLEYPFFHAPFELLLEQNLKRYFCTFGASIHSKKELEIAYKAGVNYAIFGHIFDTPSKVLKPPRGLDSLRHLITQNPYQIPLYAIGGISLENIALFKDIPIHGVCMRSHLMERKDAASYVSRCMAALA